MTEHFNQLTPGELERLAWLNEELHEVGQCIGKILRHGYASYDPTIPENKRETNRTALQRELRDVYSAVSLMVLKNDIDEAPTFTMKTPGKYFHHQEGNFTVCPGNTTPASVKDYSNGCSILTSRATWEPMLATEGTPKWVKALKPWTKAMEENWPGRMEDFYAQYGYGPDGETKLNQEALFWAETEKKIGK